MVLGPQHTMISVAREIADGLNEKSIALQDSEKAEENALAEFRSVARLQLVFATAYLIVGIGQTVFIVTLAAIAVFGWGREWKLELPGIEIAVVAAVLYTVFLLVSSIIVLRLTLKLRLLH